MKFSRFLVLVHTLTVYGILLVFPGCQKNADSNNSGKTISTWVHSEPYYTVLDSALKLTNLHDTLDSPGPFTFFAPDNNGFGIFVANNTLDWPFSVSLLKNNMNVHILPGLIKEEDFPSGPNAKVYSLNGDSVFVSRNGRGLFLNGCRIRPAIYKAKNGIIYNIEKLQIAADGNIWQTILAASPLDSLRKALLRVTNAPGGDPSLINILSNSRVSIFAPLNSAFTALLQSLSLTDINQIPVSTLLSIIRYNIIPGKIFIPDIPEGSLQTIGTGTISIHWTSGGNDMPVLKGAGNGGQNTLLWAGNVLCYNGLIHVTESVLLP